VTSSVELEDELLAVDVVDLDADLAKSEPADDGERRHIVRGHRSAELADAMFARGPVEQGADDLGSEALSPIGGLHPIAHLDRPSASGGEWNPAADDPAGAVRWVITIARPSRAGRPVHLEILDPNCRKLSADRAAGRHAAPSPPLRHRVARQQQA
jgi:hypothetical protein